ncbi:DUF4388 domain-containing protein [Cyanobacterium aponinum UTEX 3222]|uniref:DUF4388 domain-containing protein n=2 Tax=Cyanobacterium aponinum TaxID=379064 RepID=A0A844GV28_9CHRO|nr:DUF4388 domain-containing protein [Cyanobacterium aponinum]WRL40715.1 DUF4388 domain-containing protein [Cyanobacterium aponinum UTEX 3222]MBD2392910.1 DUF4388 domain-containing protein [Cyanobacterium aponinum FACHB-4101]MTF37906.1 DUF4388 domain-containing protein [Cyanobacterium aponinum 0216]PHV62294.1 two-component response regulator [Cyanobacterium aponinum IPPAS B-1201]WPF87061.1 DUF4388 domain-containing protein [Cyanobacterium aponinum AL20115]
MTESSNAPKIPIREFIGTRQTTLFQSLKQPQFTGELIFGSSKGEEWIFYFYLGRIIFATGGRHPVRRWMRNVARFAPILITQISSLDESIINQKSFRQFWEYELLSYWLKQEEVTRQQLSSIIKNIIIEILFDITQRMEVVFQLRNNQSLSSQLVFIDPDQVIVEAWQSWQSWQNAKLADRFPNQCPIIRQYDKLQEKTSPKTYQIMSKLFNGKNTLRDLSLQINQDLTQITRSMLPYIQLGLIDLMDVPDIPCPINFAK